MLIENTVEVKDFVKMYKKADKKSGKRFYACEKVDFSASKGHITGLLGPNGAGKSTLLKAICGIHYPTEGTVLVNGKTDLLSIRNEVGFVSETPELEGSLNVREILFQEAFLHGLASSEALENIRKAVKLCHLEDVLDKKAATLSKGYRQRTSFARALSFNPAILVLDEFSGGLDPAQIASMRKSIKKLASERTVILSTHHIDEASSLCDFIYIMKAGKVVMNGSIGEILEKTGKKSLEDAYLFLTGEEDDE